MTREKLCSRLLVGVERRALAATERPRLQGFGALPLTPPLSSNARAIERNELLAFTGLSARDVDRTRQV